MLFLNSDSNRGKKKKKSVFQIFYRSFNIIKFSFSGDLADLIFVFFDPIGQALCKRTLNLVEELNHKHADRIRFYLSKADEAGHESDRQVS